MTRPKKLLRRTAFRFPFSFVSIGLAAAGALIDPSPLLEAKRAAAPTQKQAGAARPATSRTSSSAAAAPRQPG